MSDIIALEKLNEVDFRVKGLTQGSALELKEHLTCVIDNWWFHPRAKAGWRGEISYFNWNEQTVPIGLFPQMVKFCKKFGYKLKIDFDKEELFNDISDEDFEEFYKAIFRDSTFEPRDYQDESIKRALRKKRGIIESPTGSGKSLVIYTLIRFLLGVCEGKILLIVPNISLVNQMFSDFKEYGWEQCEGYCNLVFGGSQKRWQLPITISTWQSIYKKSIDFFAQYQAVIVDETHGAKASSIQKCLKKCINAEYRIGTTGTMPDSRQDQFTIYGYLGPKIFSLTSGELIDKGILSKIKIANLLVHYPKETVWNYWHDAEGHLVGNSYQEELDQIYGNHSRNGVFNFVLDNIDAEQNVLILCHKISHLKDIREYLEKNFGDRTIYEIYGRTKGDERERIRKKLDTGERKIFLTDNSYIIIENKEKVLLTNGQYKEGLKITLKDDISDVWIKSKKVYKN